MFEVWDLQSLRDKIPRSCRARDDLINQIRSIDRTKKIVVFQVLKAQEANDLCDLFSANDLVSNQAMRLLMGVSSNQNEFEIRRIAAESYMLV
ncbi:MAG: hypothetical protein KKC01_01390 [Gammaproteobacteria bacterium]|nr:hypothetical protein [Gammaproteobacteria bacterium]